jgi:hypothetical protein
VDLRVVEEHRSLKDQQTIIDRYTNDPHTLHPMRTRPS